LRTPLARKIERMSFPLTVGAACLISAAAPAAMGDEKLVS
jgi:hypothetical protein